MENVLNKSSSDKIEYSSDERVELNKKLESLAQEYKSIFKEYFLLSFVTRLVWIVLISFLIFDLTYFHLQPEKVSDKKYQIILLIISTIFFASMVIVKNRSMYSRYQKSVKDLEKNIVKEQLKENIYSDDSIKGAFEDFYIQINYLTSSRYEVYFKSVYYEYLIYGLVTFLLVSFLIPKVL